jgi:hypothetical protein
VISHDQAEKGGLQTYRSQERKSGLRGWPFVDHYEGDSPALSLVGLVAGLLVAAAAAGSFKDCCSA